MNVGIGLPTTIPGTDAATVIEWARRAEAAQFSSVAVLDRIVFPNYEPLSTLAVAAGATQRVRLVTSVLLAPLRDGVLLAKQAAGIDALSGGRLTLGLGPGWREDDFRAVGVDFRTRGRRFDEQLATMRRIWSGEPLGSDVGRIGPRPGRAGGPELLIGGFSPAAAQRVGRSGDGYIMAPPPGAGEIEPASARKMRDMADESWKKAGRPGKPRFVACAYFALGPRAADGIRSYIGDYYRGVGPALGPMIESIPRTEERVRAAIQGLAEAGADEVILWPCLAELDQVERLAALVPQPLKTAPT